MDLKLSSAYSPSFLDSETPAPRRPLLTRIMQGCNENISLLQVFNADTDKLTNFPVTTQQIYPLDILSIGGATIYPGSHVCANNTLILETLFESFLLTSLEPSDHEVYIASASLTDTSLKKFIKPAEIALTSSTKLYFWAYTPLSYNFGHWHGEFLSALATLEMICSQTYLLLPILSNWQRECLDLCGYPTGSYQEVSIDRGLYVPNLLVSSASYVYKRDLYKTPLNYMTLIERIRSNASKRYSNCQTFSRVYLTRKTSAARAIGNTTEVEAAFAKRDFQIIDLEGLPYGQGIHIIANADIIAGPSGSALSRVLFAKKSSIFIQLSIKGGWHPAFHFNASIAGVKASYAYAESLDLVSFQSNPHPLIPKVNTIIRGP